MAAASYVQDTPHVLRQLDEMNKVGPQRSGTFLFTMDVVDMYPSIPTARGPGVQRTALERAGMDRELVDWVTRATKAVLEYNTFEYDGELFTQQEGAGIGAPASCSYSGIFLEMVETEGIKKFVEKGRNEEEKERRKKALVWFGRFRDDILGLFCGTTEEFEEFILIMNEVDSCIRFTHYKDVGDGVTFLDLKISLSREGFLDTNIFRKDNVKNQLLLPSSCHPKRITTNSVYSLGLRIRRNVSDHVKAEIRFQELSERFRERQYDEQVIKNGIERAKSVSREDALRKVEKKKEKKPPHLIVKYERKSSPALARILRNNHQAMVSRNRKMGKVFERPPRVVFERHRNLKDILTRARVAPARYAGRHSSREVQNGVTRCSKGRGRTGCTLCSFMTDRHSEVVQEVRMAPSGLVE